MTNTRAGYLELHLNYSNTSDHLPERADATRIHWVHSLRGPGQVYWVVR